MDFAEQSKFMKAAVREGRKGLENGDGGPFGAVIVRNGEIIASAHNEVIRTSDPTAHAEINAIRKASALLKRFDLSDCEIYTTCEPCPMCFAAIHWAKMTRMYYGCDRKDAAEIGFDDNFIYQVIMGRADKIQVSSEQLGRADCLALFKSWTEIENKTQY